MCGLHGELELHGLEGAGEVHAAHGVAVHLEDHLFTYNHMEDAAMRG